MATLSYISIKQARVSSNSNSESLLKIRALLRAISSVGRKKKHVITPELQAEIDQAEEDYRKGNTLRFKTIEEMNAWLDSL